MKCPKCKSPMVERSGKFGAFLGCSRFPVCKGTRQLPRNGLTDLSMEIERPATRPETKFNPSKYQAAIFENVSDWDEAGNLICDAVAGSGKTTTLEQAAWDIPDKRRKTTYLVFNAHNREEAKGKMPPWVTVQTAHQFGLTAIRENSRGSVRIDGDKVYNILKNLTGPNEFKLIGAAIRMISVLKNTMADPETCLDLADKFSIDLPSASEWPKLKKLVKQGLQKSNQKTKVVDFDDMVYLPNVVPAFRPSPIQFGFFDEVQDWNLAMIEMVKLSLTSTSRVLAVGDPYQSIYAFRGADQEAMARVANGFNTTSLPLSISYRVPLIGVALVNQKFPYITFEAGPSAIDGNIRNIGESQLPHEVEQGDLVLCRTNAPMVRHVYNLITKNIPCQIVGRNLGQEFLAFCYRFYDPATGMSLEDFIEQMEGFVNYEVQRLLEKGEKQAAINLFDKFETVMYLAESATTFDELQKKIEFIFAQSDGVRFSTVHRAKGLEADRVFILRPDLMPHPMAGEDESGQEANVEYVAITRFKKELIYVHEEDN